MADAVADLSLASLAARLLGPLAVVAEDAVRRLGLAIDGPLAADGAAAAEEDPSAVVQADGASSSQVSAGTPPTPLGLVGATPAPLHPARAADRAGAPKVGRSAPPGQVSGEVLPGSSAPGAPARAEAETGDVVQPPAQTGRAADPASAGAAPAGAPAAIAAVTARPQPGAARAAPVRSGATVRAEDGPSAARPRATIATAAPVPDAVQTVQLAGGSSGRPTQGSRPDVAAGSAGQVSVAALPVSSAGGAALRAEAGPRDVEAGQSAARPGATIAAKPAPDAVLTVSVADDSADAPAPGPRLDAADGTGGNPSECRELQPTGAASDPAVANGARSSTPVGPRPERPASEIGLGDVAAMAAATAIPPAALSPAHQPQTMAMPAALPPQLAEATTGLLRLCWPDRSPPEIGVDWPAAALPDGAPPALTTQPMRVPAAAQDWHAATPPRQWRRIGNRLDRALAPVFGQAARVSGLVDTAEQPAAMPQTYPAEMAAESGSAQAGRYVRPSVPLSEPSVNDPAADSGFDAPATQVSNTFNVKVALDGGGGAAERRRIEESIGEWLHQAARRQGLLP